ncbi:16S rRNA methyltransferase G [Halioglobus sp. HI00S01]|uniref:16S rRNA (guanine(527)-N(7))-methyltransferase RsmG n=1 Tax=Halioglobus sp. HI00S01 TaxID=1822214 RepID=UPI0007C26681|nr:16S rRNA (guanine(527)-N(7))-methyltransferase RsmG [Halioglobus sp. HI00S01]KZX55936.1 16S rRNA methyltransferase G [Halioglobus sp. HI00S01]
MDSALTSQLEEGCRILNVAQQPQHQPQLLAYLELLIKWNKAYNLTAVRDPAQMVTKHLLDSLAIAPHLRGQRLIDVGTGGGLPGVPMAILFPQREFHLLDSNGKKTRFLFQVKTALRLDNMTVHQARVESFAQEAPYDTVLSRAFATIEDMVGGCRHLLGPDGHFLAMKGVYPEEEIAAVADSCRLEAVHELHVPGLDEQRHLVDMTPR